jgi:hypothetical protein
MGNGTTLTLSGSATDSFVINVNGPLNLDNVNLIGGLTANNVIFNVLNGDTITDNSPDLINGILMDISGAVNITNGDTVNGEIISGNTITISNGSDVQVVPAETVPEASTAAYFTLGPLSLVAVMLLYRRFSRRKETIDGWHGCRQQDY